MITSLFFTGTFYREGCYVSKFKFEEFYGVTRYFKIIIRLKMPISMMNDIIT